jgi:hypothetical protein
LNLSQLLCIFAVSWFSSSEQSDARNGNKSRKSGHEARNVEKKSALFIFFSPPDHAVIPVWGGTFEHRIIDFSESVGRTCKQKKRAKLQSKARFWHSSQSQTKL